MREKEEEEVRLQKEVDEMRKNPVVCGALMHINMGKGRPLMGSGSASTPAVESSSAPASVPSPTLASFQIERPPLNFSCESSPDGIAQSPPKDDIVMNDENENFDDGDGI